MFGEIMQYVVVPIGCFSTNVNFVTIKIGSAPLLFLTLNIGRTKVDSIFFQEKYN